MSESYRRPHRPRIGDRVRFVDGEYAGRVSELGESSFLVEKKQDNDKSFVFPYSTILSISNDEIRLQGRDSRPRVLKSAIPLRSKKSFIDMLNQRLNISNPEQLERISKIVLCLINRRLEKDLRIRLKKSLPPGMRKMNSLAWGKQNYFLQMSDFLLLIKQAGNLGSMEEAYMATSSIIGALKLILPRQECLDIQRSLPLEIKEIWETAREQAN